MPHHLPDDRTTMDQKSSCVIYVTNPALFFTVSAGGAPGSTMHKTRATKGEAAGWFPFTGKVNKKPGRCTIFLLSHAPEGHIVCRNNIYPGSVP